MHARLRERRRQQQARGALEPHQGSRSLPRWHDDATRRGAPRVRAVGWLYAAGRSAFAVACAYKAIPLTVSAMAMTTRHVRRIASLHDSSDDDAVPRREDCIPSRLERCDAVSRREDCIPSRLEHDAIESNRFLASTISTPTPRRRRTSCSRSSDDMSRTDWVS